MTQPVEETKRRLYVIGFAFSHDLKKVYLIKKNRPNGEKGLLSSLGGLVIDNELLQVAMSRKFHEQCGCSVDTESWIGVEYTGNNDWWACVYTVRLAQGVIPCKTTDEELWSVYWNNYTQSYWEKLGVASDVPYLISKCYYTLNKLTEKC